MNDVPLKKNAAAALHDAATRLRARAADLGRKTEPPAPRFSVNLSRLRELAKPCAK